MLLAPVYELAWFLILPKPQSQLVGFPWQLGVLVAAPFLILELRCKPLNGFLFSTRGGGQLQEVPLWDS